MVQDFVHPAYAYRDKPPTTWCETDLVHPRYEALSKLELFGLYLPITPSSGQRLYCIVSPKGRSFGNNLTEATEDGAMLQSPAHQKG